MPLTPAAVKASHVNPLGYTLQEIQALADCKCRNITEYYGSVLQPGSTELHIVMELMACSVAELVGTSVLQETLIQRQPSESNNPLPLKARKAPSLHAMHSGYRQQRLMR